MDPRLIGYLTRALDHELAAVQQYMAQSKLCDLWDMAEYCAHFRQDVQEELGHVEALMEALLRLGVAPHGAHLAPVRLGRSLGEMIAIDRLLEIEAVRLYEEAAAYCARVRDAEHHALFQRILRDEVQHLDELGKMEAALKPEETCHA